MPYLTEQAKRDLNFKAHYDSKGRVETLSEFLETEPSTLLCCILEIYRRLVSGYEDKKIQENGDAE